MFPNLTSAEQEVDDGGPVAYFPYSDGYDDGYNQGVDDPNHYLSQFKTVGPRSLSSLIHTLKSRGQRVDCVIYTFLPYWAINVAREHGIPSAQYWIQPATVFGIYYHSFHGYEDLISAHCKDPLFTVELPRLPPLCIRDLPSFLITPGTSGDLYSAVLVTIKESFSTLDSEVKRSKRRPKILVNTFDELEVDALSAVDDIDLIAIGPIMQPIPKDNEGASGFNLFRPDEKAYMQWLDSKPKKSVVYASFGSLAILTKRQMEEISKGLRASGRPYLWVVRRDCRLEGVELEDEESAEKAMVVEWCSQVRVLTHPSVGCFVTHYGWNSTLESLVFGVPTVGLPQWSDQATNMMLSERAWGTGVRAEVNDDGILEGEELRRCLDLITGESERGKEIRRKAELWKEKAAEAMADGGSSERNLRSFVKEIATSDQNDH
ncbi:uncharacterized protein A4U43_C01F21650 [Asparagus officinalis]|uniref:Glycosyltransferase n=2 Tax=Asparagus officinalis TaxID=4686 RepID=A0A5P1FVI9_ASPOF|nr:uncharacterized protein A4U43_C01F21650 [Asparagus officinalis]